MRPCSRSCSSTVPVLVNMLPVLPPCSHTSAFPCSLSLERVSRQWQTLLRSPSHLWRSLDIDLTREADEETWLGMSAFLKHRLGALSDITLPGRVRLRRRRRTPMPA